MKDKAAIWRRPQHQFVLKDKQKPDYDEDCLDDRKKMTELDYAGWLNSIAETCKMTEFARTVNLNCLSLTEIKVYSPLDLKVYNPLDLKAL